MNWRAVLCACLVPGAAWSETALTFPAPAERSAERREVPGSYALPTGPWTDGAVPSRTFEGPLAQTAWRLDAPDATTLGMFAALRAQVEAAGWTLLFECETDGCGGFDFRYSTDILPEPDMHLDLGDFRFLAATREGPAGPEALSLLVSRSARSGFVQLTEIGGWPLAPAAAVPDAMVPSGASSAPGPMEATVSEVGRALAERTFALDDLVFDTGSATLGSGEFPSLVALAAWLADHPSARVILVGHTDASGTLAGNVELSEARAASVRARLVERFDVPAEQIEAEGVGYLVPRAPNGTDEGRALNRRVEAMRLPE